MKLRSNAVVVEPLEFRRLFAATGVDVTYGDLGTTRLDLGLMEGAISLGGGSLLAFGRSGDFSMGRVARLDAAGALDPTFAGTGTLRFGKFAVTAATVQPDGKIVLAGMTPGLDRVAVARVTP